VIPTLERWDRYVKRSHVRLAQGASRTGVADSIEQALRLANLPGEDEGRLYCFRSISISSVSAVTDRGTWNEQVQKVLSSAAAGAVHGSDVRAASAAGVYFNSLEEALEILLRKALRGREVAQSKPVWFSASVLGTEAESGQSELIPAVLQVLRSSSIPPGAAAAIVFTALDGNDPIVLLNAIPANTLREWVRELDGQRSASAFASPVELPTRLKAAIREVALYFGWKDSATVWLASQGVICVLPTAWNSGTAVQRARSILLDMETSERRKPMPREVTLGSGDAPPLVVFEDDEATARSTSMPMETSPIGAAERDANGGVEHRRKEESSPEEEPDTETVGQIKEQPEDATAATLILGEPTEAAGLCFLLNALSRLGIAKAIDACPEFAQYGLPAEILRRLAVEAGVIESDSILGCLGNTSAEFTMPSNVPDSPSGDILPKGFSTAHPTAIDGDYLVRAWAVAAKWWCWRAGRINVRDIVKRNGRVWRTRTDLDVTLPLSQVDIRIRRIGLDIDPGWLPWFGKYGCVVRFHYSDRESG
jgi:hypothetical protein